MDNISGSTSGSRSLFSPKPRDKLPKRMVTITGKSAQRYQIILKTPSHYVERFGNTLPVIITEALTFIDSSTVVSVRISECGFAWLVCGRRLLVWQYRQLSEGTSNGTPQRKAQGGQCFELLLPQSDLTHRAELICVFLTTGSHSPACIAVSPEGVIRYWPNISHEGVSVEQIVDLQGQECDSLCALGGKMDGCVLATTTCTIVLVQPRFTVGGRHSLDCHTLKTPSGWLGGLSKRMSSLIFGPMAAEPSGETKLVRVLSVKQSEDHWHVYVLAGHSLQKWLMSSTDPEQLIYVTELSRIIRDAYQCTAWESCGSDPSDIDMWLLDMQIARNSIMLLAAAVNLHVAPQVQYALIRLDAEVLKSSAQIEEFLLLKLYGLYQEDNTADFLSYKLLLCENSVLIHRQRDITIIEQGNEPDLFDFGAIGDKLLGASLCSNIPIFFSKNQGLVAIYPSDHSFDLYNNSIFNLSEDKSLQMNETVGMQTTNLSLYNLNPEDMLTAQKDVFGQVKAAFLHHVRYQHEACQEILGELFPIEGESRNEIDNILDKVIISISSNLLDDIPIGDPRWLNEQGGLGSSSSMQIHYQLEDKEFAQNLLLKFLQQSGLWPRLSAVTVDNAILATTHILADHSEFLIATVQFNNLFTTKNYVLQDAIDFAVTKLYEEPKPELTAADVFFREVTKVDRGIWALVEKCVEVTSSEHDPSNVITIISETNNIILKILGAIMQHRQQKATFYAPAASVMKLPIEYLPWTVNTSEYCIYESLNKQQSLTLRYGAKVCTERATKASLYDQYVSLIDIMLDARKCHVHSVQNTHSQQDQKVGILLRQYQQERYKLIQPLVEDREWERAALLAEKYLDFTTLVMVCETTNNHQRLDDYLERFKDEDFAQHMFNWYLREGKQGKILARCRATAKPTTIAPSSFSSLNKFLGAHPQLKWLQYVFQGDYETAAQILKVLAMEEKDMLTKKKSMLSFAKLSSFIANGVERETQFVKEINTELNFIQIQEEISDDVLATFGYDVLNPPVLNLPTIVQLCVTLENQISSEYDFMKALEVASHIPDIDYRNDLILLIWSSAILRNNIWTKHFGDIESPIEVIKYTIFYKLTDLAITLGSRPNEILPPIDMLLNSSHLGKLTENTHFQYVLKLTYDYFFRSYGIYL